MITRSRTADKTWHLPFAGSVILCLLGCARVYGQSAPQLEQIIARWEERQNKVVSARFRWTEEQTRTKGSATKQMPPFLKEKVGEAPPTDHTFTKPYHICLDRDKLRYEYDETCWHNKQFRDCKIIYTFDGNTLKRFEPFGLNDFPFGQVRSENEHMHVSNYHIRAVMMLCRPTYPRMAPYRGAPMKLTGRQVAVGGRSCWELNVVPMGSGQRKESIWVDPERDYLATRFILSHGGLPTYKVDVSYKADSDLGWIPDSWTMVQIHEDGSLLMTAHSKMNEYSINPICDKSDFDVVFPPGTYVQNEKTNTDFIQETGGDVRIVPPNERNRSYEELVSTPGPSGSARLWNWPVATVGGAIVLTGLVLAVRYLKHRRIKDVCCSPKSVPDTKE